MPGALWQPDDPGILQLPSYALVLISEDDAEAYFNIPRQGTAKTEVEADITTEDDEDEDIVYDESERQAASTSCAAPATQAGKSCGAPATPSSTRLDERGARKAATDRYGGAIEKARRARGDEQE